jgi:malto-oligosyltrehalose synthase
MSAPRATMRLQLNHEFTFADASRLVPYMADLGISHLYSSPILAARTGSMHGYDVTDPTRVNPELGGEDGLRSLVATLRAAGLGLIVDIVPNHMASGGMENPWWADVLRHGRASRYATYFDIDWDTQGKVLAPFLGEPYGETLREGRITLARGNGEPVIRYYDARFPIRPEDFAQITAAAPDAFDTATETGRDRLHRLLEHQHYRLAWWRSAGDATNWRRFFDINGLVGMRIEDDAVFEATHTTLFRLYEEGLIDGVRVDHVDGLADPPGYCRGLRARLDELATRRPRDALQGRAWLVVEKILGAGERMPDDWGVDGTSGYDFMDEVSAVLHDPSGEAPLRALWSDVSGRPADFAEEETAARRDVLEHSFTAQLDATVAALHRIAERNVETRDTTAAAIKRALVALLAHFPVYRSYGVGRSDAVTQAVAEAMREVPVAYHPTLALLERWLGEEATPEAAIRFQQLSAPVAAKAVEDTGYYRYGLLLSRNEVGADVRRFSAAADDFHAACLRRHKHFPAAMLTTATHDHKRGEDVRARLAVLSEIPDEWERVVRHWLAMNAPHRRTGDRPMPSPGDELMLYQMIVGAWPLGETDLREYTERLAEWQLKALREAKLETSWEGPNADYEDAVRSFLYTIMSDTAGFAAEAGAFARRIGPAGAVNGLAQTLWKLTAPGVPDFYQGAEFWDQSLVDPDNRRPVDFARRIEALRTGEAPTEAASHWRDGRIKQAVIHRALTLRREVPVLFAHGDYRPLETTGPMSAHVVAFARSHGESQCVVVVPRLSSRLIRSPRPLAREGAAHNAAGEGAGADPGPSPGASRRPLPQAGEADVIAIPAEAWRGTLLHLPGNLAGRAMRDRISGARLDRVDQRILVADVLSSFPIALLASE